MELSAAHALKERQQDALRAAERRAAESRAAELTAVESEAAELRDTMSSISELALGTRPSAQVEAAAMTLGAGGAAHTDTPLDPLIAATASDDPGADDAALCVVCFERAKTHMVFPCGHRCLCAGCSELMADACPMCRGPIMGICKVFL